MRIAVVTPVFPNGAETYGGTPLYRTALALARYARVRVLCPRMLYPTFRFLQPHRWVYRPYDPSYQPPGVDLVPAQYPVLPFVARPFVATLCRWALSSKIRAFDPDVIIVYCSIHPEGTACLDIGQRLGVPVILGMRGSELLRVREGRLLARTSRNISRADALITVSDEMHRRALKLGASAESAFKIPNGCDGNVFRVASRERARFELGVRQNSKLILFVGRLIPSKGTSELFHAFNQVVARDRDAELVCVGDNVTPHDLRSALERARITGNVRLAGVLPASEVSNWLAAANVLCLPSYSEGCPNVVLEALSCGRPVVATRVGGIPELVDNACGILVPPRRVNELAEALSFALVFPWDEQRIASNHRRTWDDVALATIVACDHTLEKRRSRCWDGTEAQLACPTTQACARKPGES